MADGQSNHKIGAIIQARFQSTRLPGKVLMAMPFPDGPPILKRIIDALRESEFIDRIIVATSTNQENDSIESFCIENQTEVFRGDEFDVQSRFIKLIQLHQFDHIIRLTADNPIVDIGRLETALKSHLTGKYDYTKTIGLPLGANFEIVDANSLESRYQAERSEQEKEHVTYHFATTESVKKNIVDFDYAKKDLRLTVDYPQDYAMLSMLHSFAQAKLDLDEVNRIIESFNWLPEVNDKMIQKKA